MYRIIFPLLFVGVFCFSCSPKKQDQAKGVETNSPQASAVSIPDTFDCKIFGKELKGHSYWLKEKQMLFALAAQGDDINHFQKPLYRTFQVYTTWDCNMISYNSLPGFGDESAPYILQANTYEPLNEVVCVQGRDEVYCYHARRRELLPPMFPKYSRPRPRSQDIGHPRGLSVLGKVLFGNERGKGTFAFDLSDVKRPKPFFPKSEFRDPGSGEIRQLFFVEDSGAYFPVIADFVNQKLELKKLKGKKKAFEKRVVPDRKTGRFAVCRISGEQSPLVIDLLEKEIIRLPNDLVETSQVLSYLEEKFY